MRTIFLKSFSALFLIGSASSVFAQSEITNEIESILHDPHSTYAEITTSVDSIFDANDFGYVSVNLDGAQDKYERWKSFWENCRDESDHLVDFTRYFREKQNQKSVEWCDGVEIDVDWTNLNYNENLGYQIDHGRTGAMGFSPSNPNLFYVGASWGGLWKTEDGGASYVNVNDRLPLASVGGIYVDPVNEAHLLISLGDITNGNVNSIGIYESFDSGVTFQATAIDFSLTQNKTIYALASNFGSPNVLFAATSDGLLRSDDFFATYTTVQTGTMNSVQFSPTNSTIGYATSNFGKIYKTTDSGNTFTLLLAASIATARLDVDETDHNRIVVTCSNQIYYSTDGGANFTQSSIPEGDCVVNFIPNTTGGIVVGNFNTYRSDDGGVNFYPISHWLGSNGLPIIHVDQRNCFSNPYFPDGVYFCNDGGIFRYNSVANDFTNLSKDLIITQYYDIAISEVDSMILGGGSQDNGNVTRNSNGTWVAYNGTGDGMEQAIHKSFPTIRFWEFQYGRMFRYDASAAFSWEITPAAQNGVNGAWHTPYVLDPDNHNRIVSGYQRVYESTDMGSSWSYLGSNFTSNGSTIRQLAMAPSDPDNLYASTSSQMWHKTATADWAQVTTPNGLINITEIVIDNSDPDIVYICSGGYSDGNKVFKSIDGGITWENISLDLPNLPATSLRLIDTQLGTAESGIFVGTIGSVFYLPEGATQWYKYGCLPITLVNDIEIQYSTNKIFIGTYGRGIFEASLNNFELLSTNNNAPLHDINVYPNPASSALSVESDVSISSIVIYDQFMRKVETIESKGLNHVINIKHLSAGMYFFNFVDESGEITIKKVIKD